MQFFCPPSLPSLMEKYYFALSPPPLWEVRVIDNRCNHKGCGKSPVEAPMNSYAQPAYNFVWDSRTRSILPKLKENIFYGEFMLHFQ